MAIVTAQLFFCASASAALAIALTSDNSRVALVFMNFSLPQGLYCNKPKA